MRPKRCLKLEFSFKKKVEYRLQHDAPHPSFLWNDEIEFGTNSICKKSSREATDFLVAKRRGQYSVKAPIGPTVGTQHVDAQWLDVHSPEYNCIVGAPLALQSINYILD